MNTNIVNDTIIRGGEVAKMLCISGQTWHRWRKLGMHGFYHGPILSINTVAVRPETRERSTEMSSSLTRTGMRCARRTQLNVGLTKASRLVLVPRFWSSIPEAILSTWPESTRESPISLTLAFSPIRMRGSFVSSK
jgi:hypothetical protein